MLKLNVVKGVLFIYMLLATPAFAATLLYGNNWESNTTGASTTCVRSTNNPRSGSFSMRCNYSGAGGLGHDLDVVINHTGSTVYQSWWHWFPTGYLSGGDAGPPPLDHGHWWRWYSVVEDETTDHLDMEDYSNSNPGHMRVIMFLPGTALTWDIDSADINITDSTWHHYEVLINQGTSGVDNGSMKVWQDGVLIVNETNRRMNNDGISLFGRWAIISNTGDTSGLDDFVDDVEAWDSCPAITQYSGVPSCASSGGTTRYVSTTGSDSNSCSASENINTPKRNIMGATGGLACMSAGDTLYLRGGTYTESINSNAQTIPAGTAWNNAITLASYPGEVATIFGGSGGGTPFNLVHGSIQYLILDRLVLDCNSTGADTNGLSIGGGAHHIRVQDGEIKNCTGGINAAIYNAGSDIEVLRNKIHHNGFDGFLHQAIYFGYPNMLIDGNELYQNAAWAIQSYNSGGHPQGPINAIVRNNIMRDNHRLPGGGGGIVLFHCSSGCQIYNNLVYNHPGGIELGNGSFNVKIENNTVYNAFNGYVLDIPTNTSGQVTNNIFSSFSGAPNLIGSNTMTTNLCNQSATGCATVANPQFANAPAGDFHLTASSPMSPSTNLCSTFTTDAEGRSRTCTTSFGFGALLQAVMGGTVRYVSPSGSGTDCTNIATPCAPNTAIGQSSAGDTVYFRAGIYTSPVDFGSKSGASGNPITYSGYPNEVATLRFNVAFNVYVSNADIHDIVFQEFTVDGSTQGSQESGIFLYHDNSTSFRVQRITLQDLVIDQWTGHGIQGYFAEDVTIQRVKISRSGRGCPWPGGSTCRALQGIYGTGPRWIIQDSEFFDNDGYGIQIYNQFGANANDTIIRRNKIYANRGDGGLVLGFGDNIQFYNNLIYNNTGGGLYPIAYGVTNAKVYNNTFYGNGNAPVLEVGGQGSAINTDVRNNIFSNNAQGISDLGTSTTFATNLCAASGTGCATVANPQFANAPAGDCHLTAASPMSPTTNLCGTFTTDAEGSSRTCNTSFGFGALVQASSGPPPNPPPNAIIGKYQLGDGSGTTAPDTSTEGYDNPGVWSECAGNACRTATGIVSGGAGVFNNSRYVTIADMTGMSTGVGAVVAWVNLSSVTPGVGCDISDRDTLLMRINDDGTLSGYIHTASGWPNVRASGVNVLNSMNTLIGVSYDQSNIRLWYNNANVATVAQTGPIDYSVGLFGAIGNHADGQTRLCTGRIGPVYFQNYPCDAACMNNYYQLQVPQLGLSTANWQFYQADAVEGVTIAGSGLNADNILVNREGKARLRFGIRNAGSLVEDYFPLHCKLNNGAMTRLSNSCAAAPYVCITNDSVKNMGDPTANLLPLGGFNFTPGRFVVDTINALLTTTIPTGSQTEWEYGLAFGSGLTECDLVTCEVRKGNDSALDSAAPGFATIQFQITPTGPQAVSSILGGNIIGGNIQ